MSPLDLSGPTFLGLYAALFAVLAAVCHWAKVRLLNPRNVTPANPSKLSPFEVAFLSGGTHAAVDAAVAALVKQGLANVDGARVVATARGQVSLESGIRRQLERTGPEEPLETEILARISRSSDLNLLALRTAKSRAVQAIRVRLEQLGLAAPFGLGFFLAKGGPFWFLAVLGVTKFAVGIARDRPVGFLFVMLLLTFAYMWSLGRRALHLTTSGRALLDNLRERNDALSLTAATAPQQLVANDIALAYGLFGTPALVGALAPVAGQITLFGAPVDTDIEGADARFRDALGKPDQGRGCGAGGGCGGGGGGGGGGCGGCGGCGG